MRRVHDMLLPESVKLAVLRAMPAPPAWITAKQVYDAMDQYGRNTIRQALLEMSRDGRVAKWGPVMEPCFQRIDGKPSAKLKLLMAEYRKNLEAWKNV